mgnify:CR=1 FL=1
MFTLDKTQKIIFDALNDGVLIIDTTETVRYVNKSYTRITGVTFKQIVGHPLTAVRPGSRLGGVMRSGKPLLGVKRIFDDTEYMTDMYPIFEEDKCVGGISIVRDIEEIQKLQIKLGKYRLRYNNLLRQINKELTAVYNFKDILGSSATLKHTKDLAAKLAVSDIPILIRGESGTGKELFAHAIHLASQRVNQPFVVVNCAAIPGPLLESELFGYVDGAFSGAKHGGKQGLITLADTGTLFLDEIGDMDLGLQAKILRVIQSGEIQPVGSEKPHKVDIRIIAATNVDLEKQILTEKFRLDLFYRLNAAQISIPPLRQRTEDIIPLAEYFLDKYFIEHPFAPLHLDDEIQKILKEFPWQGNVRELENTMRFLGNITDSQVITAQYLPPLFHKAKQEQTNFVAESTLQTESLKKARLQAEIQIIKEELQKHGHSVEAKKAVAQKLGISLATLYQRLSIQ